MPVFLLYFTAEAGPDGRVIFYPDTYGWDRMVLQKVAGRTSSRT